MLKTTPEKRNVYEIDPETKLVQRVIECRNRGGQWHQVSQREYLDYNKPIDPKVFRPDLPEDVVTVDQSQRGLDGIGLAQGGLTDDQIAMKLARECFEALVAGDWKKAGRLNDGIPGEALAKCFKEQGVKILRIVEIGSPTTLDEPRASVKIVNVPVKAEIEKKGEKTIESWRLRIRRVDKNSDRWSIGGGL
jgi:hypothetical protein